MNVFGQGLKVSKEAKFSADRQTDKTFMIIQSVMEMYGIKEGVHRIA